MSVTAAHAPTVSRLSNLKEHLEAWRRDGHSVGLVVTQGNVHRGHQQLLRVAAKGADRVILVAYVLPAAPEEANRAHARPRTHEHDVEAAAAAGANLVYTPADFDLFPTGVEGGARVDVPDLSGILCGRARPGYFATAATVMVKLVHALTPVRVVIGEKDYQECVILRRVFADLLIPAELVTVPTVREHDGLAISAGNRQLSLRERNVASRLYETLVAIRRRLQKGERDYALLQDVGMKTLERAGFVPEYVSVRQAADLSPARADTQHYAVLAAAHLGACRLADNLVFKREGA